MDQREYVIHLLGFFEVFGGLFGTVAYDHSLAYIVVDYLHRTNRKSSRLAQKLFEQSIFLTRSRHRVPLFDYQITQFK